MKATRIVLRYIQEVRRRLAFLIVFQKHGLLIAYSNSAKKFGGRELLIHRNTTVDDVCGEALRDSLTSQPKKYWSKGDAQQSAFVLSKRGSHFYSNSCDYIDNI